MPSSKSPVVLSSQSHQLGHAQGGQQPITGATIQLWQVNTVADGGLGTPMLAGTVTSSDGSGNAANSNANAGNQNNSLPAGYFTITNAYTCPPSDALVYITASGGNPGLTAGTNNPQSQMVTALGSCNNLKNNVQFINISEQTTVATVAALYPFMSAYNAIGASPAHAADLSASFPLMNEYVDFQAGVAPGPALPAGYSASTGDLNLLANVLSTCVNSSGGAYNDGSPCGTLFYNASASSSNPSTDITAAALYIRKTDINTYGNIPNLATPQAPFQPTSTPPNWSLPIFELPSTPTFSLTPGTYSGAQQLNILDAAPVTIYYSFGGAPATTNSLIYSGAITVGKSETINAIAVAKQRVTTSQVSATYTITGIPANLPTVSVTSPAIPVSSTAGVSILATSSVDGSVVTFGTSGSIGGSFSPATCTVSGGQCSVSYTPSGTASAGTYTNDITANYTATSSSAATIATGTVYVVPVATVVPLAALYQFSPIQASDGNFYGIGFSGAYYTIYQLSPSGNLVILYTFTYQYGAVPNPTPQDRLVQGTDGSFYGVTYAGGSGGNGSIFKIDPLGNFTQLYSFTGSLDGAKPQRALVQGTDGSFYGVAAGGGASGYGTAFKVDASGNFTLLHAFTEGSEGGDPNGSLLQGADGNFYGTTGGGGTYALGTVFKMDLAGNVTTLYSFTGGADGSEPYAGLVQATDGNFYGTTLFGGTFSGGGVFKISSSGNFTALHSFAGGSEGSRPEGALVQATDGALYGTASYSIGSLFKVDLSGNFTLVSTLGGAAGSAPDNSTLVQGSDGSLYGGDSNGGSGVFFKLTPSPALTGPVTLNVPAVVTHGSSFTLTYTVFNAASQTMQRCFATNNAGDVSGWTGVKTASTSATSVTLTAPAITGTYSYALTCGGVESGFTTLVVDQPSAPVFSPVAGTYFTAQSVTLSDTDPNAVIYYTTNGSNPTASSTRYTGAISVSSSETIKAIAVESGISSAVATGAYAISPPLAPTAGLSAVTAISGSVAAQNITATSNSNGSVVTFGVSGQVDGSFSPAACTITNGSCTTTYLPSGLLGTGTYINGLTASFGATTMYTTATASSALTIAAGPAFSVLYTFEDDPNPNSPGGPTIQGSDGQLYGTSSGGASRLGTAYKVDLSGNLTVLHTFTGGNDGSYPAGGLIEGTDGSYYGTTTFGGLNNKGNIFKIDASGNFSVLYSFTGGADGNIANSGVIQGTDGNFYGTAVSGGSSANAGVIFRVTPAGALTTLYAFTGGNDGSSPVGLLQGSDGNFYGSATYGGAHSEGTLFKIDTSGNFTLLHAFNVTDGNSPGSLVEGANGNYYGVAANGGPTNTGGTIYEIDSSGNFTLLYSSQGGSDPIQLYSLELASDGNFYGTGAGIGSPTTNYGTLFRMDTAGNLVTLYSFHNGADGELPYSTMVQASNGSFYGTASGAGTGYAGTLFELTPSSPGLTAPVVLTVPASVTHGTSFTLTYSAANAYSQTMQQCFATNTAGDASGWTGIKTASTSATNVTLTAPATAGTYSYALTCGGVESGFATLNVN